MHTKNEQLAITVLFCGFLGLMLVLYLFLPKSEFSQLEKRYLAETPVLNRETLSSGEFSEDVDAFMADHIPGRSFFVGLHAAYELVSGRQASKDILLTQDLGLVEAPPEWNTAAVEKNMGILKKFADAAPVTVDLMLVPSGGWAARNSIRGLHPPYRDDAIIESIYASAPDTISTVDVVSSFAAAADISALYYRTDHHWTSTGAYSAYGTYAKHAAVPCRPASDFRIESIGGFYGSTYTRAGLWMIPGEDIELWHGSEGITVTHEESTQPHDGVFFRNRLEEADKYTVFLDGNHSLVRIRNAYALSDGKILVVRDSFCNSLGGFLAESWEEVVMADLRYYRQSLSELIAQEDFDRVLICYSLNNFLTDTNIVWLR